MQITEISYTLSGSIETRVYWCVSVTCRSLEINNRNIYVYYIHVPINVLSKSQAVPNTEIHTSGLHFPKICSKYVDLFLERATI